MDYYILLLWIVVNVHILLLWIVVNVRIIIIIIIIIILSPKCINTLLKCKVVSFEHDYFSNNKKINKCC